MSQACGQCGASNTDGDGFCRNCGPLLGGSVGLVMHQTSDGEKWNEQGSMVWKDHFDDNSGNSSKSPGP